MARQERFTVFVSLQYTANPSIEGRNYSPCENIPVVDQIFVPGKAEGDEGENKLIVYQPGNKSIYTEKTLGELKETGDFSSEPINLIDGHLFIDNREILLLDYLRVCNYNESNTNRMPGKEPIFRERDKAQEAEEFLEEDFKIHQIKTLIHSGLDPDELSALAIVLGDLNADTKDTKEIRRDLIVYSRNQPTKLIEAMENTDNARKVYIIRAFRGNVVWHDSKMNQINWVNGNKICDVPMGQNPEDYLLLLTGQDPYKELLQNIKDRLPKTKEYRVVNEEPENQPPPPLDAKPAEAPAQPPAQAEAGAPAADPPPADPSGGNGQAGITPPATGGGEGKPPPEFDAEAYIKKALEYEALFKAGPYFCLKDSKKGDKYYSISNSYKKLGEKILADPELKALIDSELFSAGAK